ncbi:hypothetical protein [Lacunisphaera limnophila]|nr:hypothetical protein [Lacunisphaera limnophila]
MKCNPLLGLVAAAGLLLPALAPAQILDARPIGALPAQPAAKAPVATTPRPGAVAWPTTRPPLGSRSFTRYDEDRGQLAFTQLRFPAVNLVIDNERLDDWRKVEKPARYALEWTGRWSADLVLGFGELPATNFPVPLDAAAWNTYVGSLRAQYGTRLRLFCNDDSDTNPQMLRPLLGGRTRVLEYEIAPEKPAEPVRRVLQVFMVTPRGVLVAGYEGPAAIVLQFKQTFASLLMSMEAEDPTATPALSATSATPPALATLVRGG